MTLPPFRLEAFFAKWEFQARHHMAASDAETMGLHELLALGSESDREAWETCRLGYAETCGDPLLRQAIAETYAGVEAEGVLCSSGAEEAIYCAMHALLGKDDHAIVVTPNYQSLESVPLSIGEVTGVALREAEGWQLDVDEVRWALRSNTRVLVINFPHNPTGAVLEPDRLSALVRLADKYGLYLFSDEVYRGLEHSPRTVRPAAVEIYERGLSLGALSKAYGLPGLRTGWIACREPALIARMDGIKHYLSICAAPPMEVLARIALRARDSIVQRTRRLLAENLDRLDAFFGEFPTTFAWERPGGGCVAFPRYLGTDGVELFCAALLEEAGVLLLPASIFRSDLEPTPDDRFRVGFGRRTLPEGLEAWRTFLRRRDTITA